MRGEDAVRRCPETKTRGTRHGNAPPTSDTSRPPLELKHKTQHRRQPRSHGGTSTGNFLYPTPHRPRTRHFIIREEGLSPAAFLETAHDIGGSHRSLQPRRPLLSHPGEAGGGRAAHSSPSSSRPFLTLFGHPAQRHTRTHAPAPPPLTPILQTPSKNGRRGIDAPSTHDTSLPPPSPPPRYHGKTPRTPRLPPHMQPAQRHYSADTQTDKKE